ncbi:hypothetical protein MMC13_007098 [Lambiella insularis]|nr:hypothetical protein [Lambiella insularis]
MMNKISTFTSTVEEDLVILSQSIKDSNTAATNLNSDIARAFQQMAQGSSALAASQDQHWHMSNDLALQLQKSLELMRGQEINAIMGAFHHIHNQLQSTNELMVMMYTRQDALNDRLVTLDHSFEQLETKAVAFSALQTQQADYQVRLYEQMATKMQTTTERLAAIDASASSIGIRIKDLSFLLAQLSSLGGVVGSLLRWKWQIIAILGVAWYNRRLAVYSTTVILSFELLVSCWKSFPADAILIHHASGMKISLPILVGVLTFLILIPGIIVMSRKLHSISMLEDIQHRLLRHYCRLTGFRARSYHWDPSDRIVLKSEG